MKQFYIDTDDLRELDPLLADERIDQCPQCECSLSNAVFGSAKTLEYVG